MSEKRIALVTGGNRGIGLEVVRQLLKTDFQVVLSCRNVDQAKAAIPPWGAETDSLSYLTLDVSDDGKVEEAALTFGHCFDRLDVLVNNAGILLDEAESILTVTEEVIQQSININSVGPLRVTRAFLPFLKKSDDARVINVSSLAGQLKNMGSWAPAYSISKTTLNAVTCLLSNELKADGIKVNAVSPGWIRTEMGGSDATGSLEEGADTIMWLATEASGKVTGQFLRDREPTDW